MNDVHTIESSLFSSKREQTIVYFLVSVGVFALTVGFFYAIDFLPEKPGTNDENVTTLENAPGATEPVVAPVPEPVAIDPLPTKIIFESLDNKVVPILNPEARSVVALDTALLSGAVRHPDSADFEQKGTILLLGHSSYLPNVINKNFQAFNGIQKLVWGDTIRLQSSDMEYVYRVDRVYQAKAEDGEVKIETGTPKLTLSTCNSFGTKDDRFIVESSLVESRPLANNEGSSS